MRVPRLLSRLSLLPLLSLAACSTPFDPPSLVEGVRLLAISADKPYAAPGDTVTMKMLAFDDRAAQPAPMRRFWVPVVCPDPPGDAYYACYPFFGELLSPGVDVSAKLVEGEQLSFRMPSDVISGHAPSPTYGVVVVFAMACAGHAQLVERGGGTIPPAPPLGCFGADGVELGPDDSVFAYAEVYSFAGRTNENPVIEHLTFAGKPVDPGLGITVDRCAGTSKCPTTALDTVVPSSSWQLDPADRDATGAELHEEIWVDYYVTGGAVSGGSSLLYDAHKGKLSSSYVKLTAPATTGTQFLWAVVHDNRGGVSWTEVPMNVK